MVPFLGGDDGGADFGRSVGHVILLTHTGVRALPVMPMKARIGFVSNSSTSSFVISWLPADIQQCLACHRGHVDPLILFADAKHRGTQIECSDADKQQKEWQEIVEKNTEAIAELEKLPAGQIIPAPADWEMTEEERIEYEPFLLKAWQTIAAHQRNIDFVNKKINRLKKLTQAGRQVIWGTISYEDSLIEKQLTVMENQKVIRFEKELSAPQFS